MIAKSSKISHGVLEIAPNANDGKFMVISGVKGILCIMVDSKGDVRLCVRVAVAG